MWLSRSSASSGVRPARLLLYCMLGAVRHRVKSEQTAASKQSCEAQFCEVLWLLPVMRWTVARIAKAHSEGTLGALKGLLGGDGCPWLAWRSSCCAARWRRSTAAWPAAAGASGPPAFSGSAASSSGPSLRHTNTSCVHMLYFNVQIKQISRAPPAVFLCNTINNKWKGSDELKYPHLLLYKMHTVKLI